MTALTLSNVSKSFGTVEVLKNINIDVEEGEFVVFVGPSGCGKSTLLRTIAGLDDVSSGEVLIDNKKVNRTPPSKRGIAMVFQSYALYPHLNVRNNMTLALKQAKESKDVIEQRLAEASRMLSLEDYLDRYPSELSGGQRQRVAIGRAIVRHPKLFLFDEPLSNLDAALRMNTRLEIANLHQTLGATMIYVTHDQTEAMTLADKIVVLRDGRVEQVGSPMELYNNPANQFVAGFLGSPGMNFLPATLLQDGNPNTLGVRPEDLFFDDNGPLEITTQHVEHLGGDTNVIGTCQGQPITLRLFGQQAATVGAVARVSIAQDRSYFFSPDGSRIR
ncbi:ABC transporter ATP-binding protein [Phaeobacter sp. B1627]|uniref:ABC transporter ATP-binding protein n=1 Tax=Phaeobacter sp. B1627 TaxID=2583809 RepID=UPI001119EC71|nr:ABC transporter ATP-binding protein [Phaeobacter sp. B1627]TNJ47442.1 ABC transporter ATP-binding protein [Phaeobacter sp. B1627]